ncbi:MAG: hypothetical protein NVS9B10_16120 [Nevskia sp.]
MSAGLELLLDDAEATERLGAALARALVARPGLVVFLEGELGAGKTTLARGWLRALGATGPIRSPTYTLIEPYCLDGRDVLHMDLYRLRSPHELEGLGLDDYAPQRSWWLVEWPAQGGERMPPPDLRIALQMHDQKRKIRIDGPLSSTPETAAAAEVFRSGAGRNIK